MAGGEDDKKINSTEWLDLKDEEGTLRDLEALREQSSTVISHNLDALLSHVAKTGDTVFSWDLLRPLIKVKVETVLEDFVQVSPVEEVPPYPNVDAFKFNSIKSFLLERVEFYHRGPPFTIQRICELLTEPMKHHKRIDKFMRALEKNFMVISSPECFGRPAIPEPMVNGMPEVRVPPASASTSSSSSSEEEEEADVENTEFSDGEEDEEKIDVDAEPHTATAAALAPSATESEPEVAQAAVQAATDVEVEMHDADSRHAAEEEPASVVETASDEVSEELEESSLEPERKKRRVDAEGDRKTNLEEKTTVAVLSGNSEKDASIVNCSESHDRLSGNEVESGDVETSSASALGQGAVDGPVAEPVVSADAAADELAQVCLEAASAQVRERAEAPETAPVEESMDTGDDTRCTVSSSAEASLGTESPTEVDEKSTSSVVSGQAVGETVAPAADDLVATSENGEHSDVVKSEEQVVETSVANGVRVPPPSSANERDDDDASLVVDRSDDTGAKDSYLGGNSSSEGSGEEVRDSVDPAAEEREVPSASAPVNGCDDGSAAESDPSPPLSDPPLHFASSKSENVSNGELEREPLVNGNDEAYENDDGVGGPEPLCPKGEVVEDFPSKSSLAATPPPPTAVADS